MEKIRNTAKLLPGFGLALIIAAAAKFIESLLPIHLIGASVIALFIGMIINHFWKPNRFLSDSSKMSRH